MAEPASPPKVKLICGMISARAELFDQAAKEMEGLFAPVELTSEVMSFDFTDYYDRQMGSPLWRRLVAFAGCRSPDVLVEAKWATNALERQFALRLGGPPQRPINLDVGYVEPSKLVLASMKNFSHRIYLGRSVYADLTLMYRRGAWEALPWTFPDYASGRYHPFLTQVRALLRQQVQQEDSR